MSFVLVPVNSFKLSDTKAKTNNDAHTSISLVIVLNLDVYIVRFFSMISIQNSLSLQSNW